MPFSRNKDVHVLFNENLRNQLNEDQLRTIKKTLIKALESHKDKGSVFNVSAEDVSAREAVRDPLIFFQPFTRLETEKTSTHTYNPATGNLTVAPYDKKVVKRTPFVKAVPQEQTTSSNRLESSYKRKVLELTEYLQLTSDYSDEEIQKVVSNTITTPDEYKQRIVDIKNKVTGFPSKVTNILTSEAAQKIISDVYTATLLGFSAALMNTAAIGAEGNNNVAEVIVGPVPLYSVQSMERSRSDRIVKYRAIGDVFLAHQHGTKDSLRIDGTLFGAMRHIYIIMLLTLQQRGEQRLEAIKNITTTQQAQSALNEGIGQSGDKNVAPMYEKHETFPIITQTSIMIDMYLQTIEWHESVEDGMKCIKYHLLFRKYIEPKGWEALSTDEESIKKFNYLYTNSLVNNKRKELMYDFLWKLRKLGSELYRGAWTGGKSRADWIKETTSYAPFLYMLPPNMLAHITRSETMGESYG